MGYSVYYNGEIEISPELTKEHATALEEGLEKRSLALFGLIASGVQRPFDACDWQLSAGLLSIEGESRDKQDQWLRILIFKFFQPNGYVLSGEVRWEGEQAGDTGVIHVDDNHVESVSDTITNAGPNWRPRLPESKVLELVHAGRSVIANWEGGDLAAQVQRLAGALEEFAQVPHES
jgi:hypothetical protein